MDFWLPRIKTTLVEEINRRAAATGSVTYAMQTAHADYNGHYVTVWYNDYKRYWITEYYWGERIVLARGTVQDCLRAGADYYGRGHKGAQVVARNIPDDAIEYAKSLGYVPHSEEIEKAQVNDDPRKALINEAFMYIRHFGIPADVLLTNSANAEEFKSKIDAEIQKRRKQ